MSLLPSLILLAAATATAPATGQAPIVTVPPRIPSAAPRTTVSVPVSKLGELGVPSMHEESARKDPSSEGAAAGDAATPQGQENSSAITSDVYALPGVVTFQGERLAGSDHLYNLDTSLGLVIEVVSNGGVGRLVDEKELKKSVAALFENTPLFIETLREKSAPNERVASVFLHVLVMAYPIDDKTVIAYCSLRLFEPVVVGRVKLDQGVHFQAITWERQAIVRATKESFSDEVARAITDLTGQFIHRYQYFAKLGARRS